jgi:diaminohydroxyphosphoribosylaminopyrimidine deaminase/5-amino-6-(5-phosphoribosylamino)uracil reductase
MDLALGLAERGRYTVAPNPMVGAVLAVDGRPVAEGWHARAGGPHAEVIALRACSGSLSTGRDATMHVTLEPCNHYGRTPPCTEAILRAGIARVVMGHLDPDPRMRGRSVAILRAAGVKVEVLDSPVFRRQNEQFFHHMRTGRPFVHLKLAATLDGRIAASGGDSKWITGSEARRRAHMLRSEAGAVLVGATTARLDDPTLTARDLPDEPPPLTRVVLDPSLSLSPRSNLAATADPGSAPVLVYAASPGALDGREKELQDRGVEVISSPMTTGGLDLNFVLEDLGSRGLKGVLVEGGGETAGRFVAQGLVDKATLFYAPSMMGADGVPMIGALGVGSAGVAPRFEVSCLETLGGDVVVSLYPAQREDEEADVHGAG